MPEYLYHYTSVNTLALILKSKSIRLSPLSSVDDLTECLSADEVNYGQYVFVTCWTSDEEESIPFWKMYTPDMTGVRLKVPTSMFEGYEFKPDPSLPVNIVDSGKYAVPIEEVLSKSYMVWPESANRFFAIEYVESVERIEKKIHKIQPDGSHTVALGEIGRQKTKHWEFQKRES